MKKDQLFRLYVLDELSLRQVANRLNCSTSTVRYWMTKHQISRRSKSESLKGGKNPMFGSTHSKLSKQKISKASKEYFSKEENREKLSQAFSGEGNPMFGKNHSDETKKIIGNKARHWHEQNQNPFKGKAHSVSTRKTLSEKAKKRIGEKNPFYGKKHSKETVRKISEANKGRFVGENGSNWKGGKTKIQLLVRNSTNYAKWRLSVFERDDFTCVKCGQKGGTLNADHYPKYFADLLDEFKVKTITDANNCEELWCVDNGRTLCISCHKKTENYGCRKQQ